MVVEFKPKKNFKINYTPFYKKYKYSAIIVDAWKDEKDRGSDIFGMEITGGTLRKEIVAFTRKEFESKCYITNKKLPF